MEKEDFETREEDDWEEVKIEFPDAIKVLKLSEILSILEDEKIKKINFSDITDEELREYIRREFVKSGFIEVYQWKNFVDYLRSLIVKYQEKIIYLYSNKLKEKLGE